MRRPQLNLLLLIGLAVIVILGVSLPQLRGASEAGLQSGLLLSTPRPLSDWREPMIDEAHQSVQLQDFQGRKHLLFFGFRSCPDICPNTLLSVASVYRQLSPAQQQKLGVVLISVDPGRDTPDNLAAYVHSFHPDFKAVTGPMASLEQLAGEAGIAFMQVEQGDGYTIDHSAALVLLDEQARIAAYFAPPFKLESLFADLSAIL